MCGFGILVMFRMAVGLVVLVQLLGAVRALEFVAFTGNGGDGTNRGDQGEAFHRAGS
jgi:hypothetical protein